MSRSGKCSEMFMALMSGDLRVLRRLLADGADPNAVCSPAYGMAPFHVVATQEGSGMLAVMRCLVEAGADVNVKDDAGETPVMSAATMGVVRSITFFAEHGADLTLRNSAGKTAYDIAKDPYEGSDECAQALLALGFDPVAHPPPDPATIAPARFDALLSPRGSARCRIAFVGVPKEIYDAHDPDPEATQFFGGHDAHKLQTKEWGEGCDIFETMPGSGQLDPERYTTVVTSEHLVSESSTVLQAYYRCGGRLIVFATNGVDNFASNVLSPLFDVDWKIHSYTKHTFKLTELGKRMVGRSAAATADTVEYTKSNCLQVPDGESVLLPEHDFAAAYGYTLGDTTSELYSPDDQVDWAQTKRSPDTPIAFHADSSHGGELVYVGLINIMCNAVESKIVETIIRSPPQVEAQQRNSGTVAISGTVAAEPPNAMCIICMEAPADILITPCGHLCGCKGCLESVQQSGGSCPICRGPITTLQRVFPAGHTEDALSAQNASAEGSNGRALPQGGNTGNGPWRCTACGVACGRAGFSKSQQLKGRDKCRCKTCIANGVFA